MSQAICRGCGSQVMDGVLDLGLQPGSDHFPPITDPVEDDRWRLELWLCGRCGLVQLGPVAPRLPEPPLAIESATSRAHAAHSVEAILDGEPRLVDGTVVEVASHH